MDAAATLAPVRSVARHTTCVKTIVFTDIESSTAIAASLGDDVWLDRLIRHDDVIETCADDFDGTVVKGTGDGFMLAFAQPEAAAAFCIEVRRRLDASAELNDIRVRAGIHCGSVIPHRNDFFGNVVNTAARVAGQAIGGQTLVSAEVAEALDTNMTVPFAEKDLKGLPGSFQLSSLVAGA